MIDTEEIRRELAKAEDASEYRDIAVRLIGEVERLRDCLSNIGAFADRTLPRAMGNGWLALFGITRRCGQAIAGTLDLRRP